MAAITVILTAVTGEKLRPDKVLFLALTGDTAAACDSLRLRLSRREALPEIVSITAFLDGKKVFFGYTDYQEETADGKEMTATLYARSSACILLDNEAEPYTYLHPSAEALFVLHARPFGFKNDLPPLFCEGDYYVSKGISCYGAVNQLVYGVSGKNLRVSPENALYLPDGKNSVTVQPEQILRETRSISRGKLFSRIDYKAPGDTRYRHHYQSRFLERQGICSSKKLNLASLPRWQQAYTLRRQMDSAARNYQKAELLLEGVIVPELYAPVQYESPVYGSMEHYLTDGFCVTLDENGWRTRLTLVRQHEEEAFSYVA